MSTEERTLNGTHPYMIPSLYPAKTRMADMERLLRALALFINEFGFWPRNRDLSDYMRALHRSVNWYLEECRLAGYVERLNPKFGHDRHALTEAGWELLRVRPIEPWQKPPNTGYRRRELTRRVAQALADATAEDAAAAVEQAVNTYRPPPE